MADLTKNRMSEKPPFTNCDIDLIGSFFVKDGQKEAKIYGAVYTCLPSRAIHNEVVHSLSTDSFIMSLRRFVGCRGDVRMIRSDNGSNLNGGSTELTCAFQKDHNNDFLQENGKETQHYQTT